MTENRAQSIVGFRPKGRPGDDFYPTPPSAVHALADKYLLPDIIWEPACGDGAISKALIGRGHEVISTDLVYRGYGEGGIDFLKARHSLAETIVTNPPYKLAEDFIWKAHALDVGVTCLLLKLSFLEGVSRKKLFSVYPPRMVYVFSKRLTMTRNGEAQRSSGMIAFAWFIWERGFNGSPEIGWL